MAQIIDEEKTILVRIILDIVLRSIISAAGVATNIINMVIFNNLGLKDSMSIGLFSLSFTDFLVTSFQFASGVCYTLDLLYPTSPVSSWSLGYFVFGFLINATYLMSCWITVMISVERCFCVVSPFTVKQVFTRCRCVTSVLVIYMLFIAFHIPVYTTHRMEWKEAKQRSKNGNYSVIYIFTVILNEQTGYFDLIFDISLGIVVLFLAQLIIVVCAVWMGYSLEASSRVRQSNHNRSSSANLTTGHNDISTKLRSKTSTYLKSASGLSRNEKRLVKVVLYLGVILTCGNIPRIVTATTYHTIPGMDTGNQVNLSTTLWALTSAVGSVGCSATFFVYVIVNTNFRRCFYQICRLHFQ